MLNNQTVLLILLFVIFGELFLLVTVWALDQAVQKIKKQVTNARDDLVLKMVEVRNSIESEIDELKEGTRGT